MVNTGNLYFNIMEPLEENEILNIRSSTMMVGIRGTCGWVEVPDKERFLVSLLEGSVECAASDPDTYGTDTWTIDEGLKAEFVCRNGEIEAKIEPLEADDIPTFVREEGLPPAYEELLAEGPDMDLPDGENSDGEDADDEEIAQSISVIFLFNVIAALIFPTFGNAIGLTNDGFALFAGTAVNDTSSVTAAASAWDSMKETNGIVLAQATTVKLTRTLAIIPITLVLAFMRTREAKKAGGEGAKISIKKIFPWFILYFVMASLITTLVAVMPSGGFTDFYNDYFVKGAKWLAKFFIAMAMCAIGLNANIVTLVKKGGKPIAMGFVCWAAITAVSLIMQHVLGYW